MKLSTFWGIKMNRKILLLAMLCLAATNIFAAKYWHGERTIKNEKGVSYIELYISGERAHRMTNQEKDEELDDAAYGRDPDHSVEHNATFYFGYHKGGCFIDFWWDDDYKIGIVSSRCYPYKKGSLVDNDFYNVYYKEFNDFNSALKEFKNLRDQYVRQLEKESSKETKQTTAKKQNSKSNSNTSKTTKKNTNSKEKFELELYRLRHETHDYGGKSIGLGGKIQRKGPPPFRYIFYDNGRRDSNYVVDLDGNLRDQRGIDYPIVPYYSVPKETRDAAMKSLE